MLTVYIGTAGFSYKDWIGAFYPQGISQRSMLEYYSKEFPVVEINSTYYAIPAPRVMYAMAKRVPRGFQFTIKANKEMTHEIDPSSDVFERFKQAIRPVKDYGKLGCVLAQFPWAFKNTRENRDYLEVLARALEGIDTVVEFRNSEWETLDTFELLKELDLGYCCVDEPGLRGLVSRRVEVTGQVGYVRFHGRNYETWWDRNRESWERYNYLYSEEELDEWVPKVEEMENKTDRVYVIFNNHYRGQAPTNARMFQKMLQGVLGERVARIEPAERELFDS